MFIAYGKCDEKHDNCIKGKLNNSSHALLLLYKNNDKICAGCEVKWDSGC